MDEVGKLTRAAGVVGFFTLLSRLMGLVRDMVVGYLFGAHGAADAFFVAFRIPNLLRRLTAEGALTAGFIPVFTDYLTRQGKDEAFRVARIILTFAVISLGAITVLGIALAEPLTGLFAPGFLADREKFRLTVFLTRLMFPYLLFVSLVALAMGVLNSLRHFMAPALSPVLLNLAIVLCALALSPFLREPVASLGYGVLLGGIAQLLLQLPYLSRHGVSCGLDFHFRHPALRRILLLMAPTVFGAAVYQINVLVSTILASVLPEGSVSYLYYADRLLQFPLGIFAIALGTAALPSFSALVARRDFAELRKGLAYSLGLVNFIALPATLGLMVISVPTFSLLFQRGAFDADTTLRTAQALVYFSIGLWGFSGSKLVVPVFYAMQDTRTPVWIGLGTFLLNFILSLILMGPVYVAPEADVVSRSVSALTAAVSLLPLAHGGLALATSISATVNFLLLLVILDRRLGEFPWREFLLSFSRSLISALVMAVPLLVIVRRVDWVARERDLLVHAIAFVGVIALGMALFLAFSFLLRSPEWHALRALGAEKRRRLSDKSF
ncbi:MAG: murein biosynthesis integral membrane protein MurJ [Deltaproteobacteria bacterium]|nr:murein biosynthesis integral membrane protein MurJ [Deltaproteobacteria bacterium]